MNQQGVREHFVYWMFDSDGDCLYVGMTRQPEQRWRRHRYEKPDMVAQIAYKRMSGPFLLETARKLEREQQDDLQPSWDMNQAAMRGRALSLSSKAKTAWTGGLPSHLLDELRERRTTWPR